ncbi:MAG: FHA domain-containing protein [Anaerolineae bacterium]|nr:FHA domain-containing protein [Anaerolineae bacterium]
MGSTRPKPPGVAEIFSEYVFRRQQGNSPAEAVDFIKPLLERLRNDARQQLAALLRSWEAREGKKYNAAGKRAFADDLLSPPRADEDLSWLPEPAAPASPSPVYDVHVPVHPSVENAGPNAEAKIYCPACGRANRAADSYCYSCGTLLVKTGTDTQALEPQTDELTQVGRSHFTRSSTLLLRVRGVASPLGLRMGDTPNLVLGRFTQDAREQPDVDLTPYGASDLGVSRRHVRLSFEQDTVTLIDLGSVNHTFVNGQRLHPHEVRVLADGDEVRMGRMVMNVTFQHQVRSLR